jgi:MFS family permease
MKGMFSALRVYNYRLWVAGGLISNIGTWMQRVAQDWLVLTALTNHSGTAVGITTGLQFLPILVLGPYAGLVADRVSKRVLLLWTQTAMGLFALTLGLLVVSNSVQLWQVYALALGLGVASAFDAPARQAFVSEVVDREDIRNAVALNAASFNTARLVGPGLAGLMIAVMGTGPLFLLNAASFAAVILSLLRMRVDELQPAVKTARRKRQILEGIQYVRQRPDLLMILVLAGLIGTFGLNFQIINALMATQVFGKGSAEYGLFGSVLAVGTLTAALLAARRQGSLIRYVLGGAIAFGLFTLIAAVMPNYILYAIALIPVGLASLTFLNSSNATVQLSVDPEFRGRVLALYMMVMQGGTPFGAPLVGWIGTTYGARWSVIVSGGVSLVAGMVALMILNRRNGVRLRDQLSNLAHRAPRPAIEHGS